ncbi:hypothetical protein Tco_1209656 [Tanacetum coccineum]
MNKMSGCMEESSKGLSNYLNNQQMVNDLKDDLTFVKSKLKLYDRFNDIIDLSSDSEDINEGPSKGKIPKEDINEGPSKGKLPPLGSSARPRPEVGPELAKLFNPEKETKDKSSMDTFPGSTDEETSDTESTDKNITVGTTGKNLLFYEDTIEKYVPVGKSASKKAIFRIHQPITGVVLGLANLKTWDDIVQKIGKRKPGSYADKGKGKPKV